MDLFGTTALIAGELDRKPALELSAIYRDHSAQVSRWVKRLCGPSSFGGGDAAVEDLLHEVFLVVQRQLAGFRGEAAITTWLYAITVKVVSAKRRKERWRRVLWRRAEPEIQEDAQAMRQGGEFERAESARLVYEVLQQLRERDRTLLILFELEQLPGSEIAQVLDMPESAVWVALSRARARFRAAFDQRWGDLASEGASDVVG